MTKITTKKICAGNYKVLLNGVEAGYIYFVSAIEAGGHAYWHASIDTEAHFLESACHTKADALADINEVVNK